MRRCVIVAGPGHSGTSVLSRALQALGVALGEGLMGGNSGNPKGHYEHQAIVELNDALLADCRLDWSSILHPTEEQCSELVLLRALEGRKVILDGFGQAEVFGLKDPRAVKLLCYWQAVLAQLNVADSYIIPVRNPLSVAGALATEHGFSINRGLCYWVSNIVAALRATDMRPRVAIEYDAMVDDSAGQLLRIADELSLDKPSIGALKRFYSFIDPALRHHRSTASDLARGPGPVLDLYGEMWRMALGGAEPEEETISAAERWLEE